MRIKLAMTFMCIVSLLATATAFASEPLPKPGKEIPIVDGKAVRIIVPNDNNVIATQFTKGHIQGAIWGRQYYGNKIAQQELIRVYPKSENSFDLERRVDNGTSGSGVIYTVEYAINNVDANTVFEFKPTRVKTYKQGFILPFGVPAFSEEDLAKYIISQAVGYKVEVNSEYNTESIYSNFKRLATEEHFKAGEKDPVTGKIFKNRFSLTVDDEKVMFSLETFPYHNGTKAIIYLSIPGHFTSDGTVDFNTILDSIKTQLEQIAKS